MEKNVGNLDAFLRSILALLLIGLGLGILKGHEGNLWGLLVTFTSLIPLYMVITRKCIVFKVFNISSIPKAKQ